MDKELKENIEKVCKLGKTMMEELEKREEITKKATKCEKCGVSFKPNDMKFYTPKYGVICKYCWCKEMGDFIEKHPIGGIGE